MIKGLILALAVMAAGLFVACSGGGTKVERYPQYYENQWIAVCLGAAGGSEFSDFCHCALTYVEAHTSFTDYAALEEDMASDPDYTPDVITDAANACLDKLPASFRQVNPDTPEF